jgi:hypothetical protein
MRNQKNKQRRSEIQGSFDSALRAIAQDDGFHSKMTASVSLFQG